MNKAKSGIAALSLALVGAAFAQTPADSSSSAGLKTGSGGETNALFGRLDVNHDGRVSREEAKANGELTSSWSALDADRDTYLSAAEYGKWKAPVPGAHNGVGAGAGMGKGTGAGAGAGVGTGGASSPNAGSSPPAR